MFTKELDPTLCDNRALEPTEGPIAKPLVVSDGQFIEKVACNFTHSHGDSLPEAATARNPHLAGKPFSASSLSVIVHPRRPHIPSAHMNVRFFLVQDEQLHWHFGGGMDMTPYVLYEEDAKTWHTSAKQACSSNSQYDEFKSNCEEYFYLPHRQEARGIGGLFFDDLNKPDFESCLLLTRNICSAYRTAYSSIFQRRKDHAFNQVDEQWMLQRRGRYVEFNLIYDRGTKYGLQSGRRVESVLASLPPRVAWHFEVEPKTATQRELIQCLKEPRDWLNV